jgi:hypothetical protein
MGFFVDLPAKRKAPIPDFVGPTVRLGPCTPETWSGVVFFACKHDQVSVQWTIDGQQAADPCNYEIVDQCEGWNFMRFTIPSVPLRASSQTISYVVRYGESGNATGQIPVAGNNQEWNLVAYSCYDQRRSMGEALWFDMAGTCAVFVNISSRSALRYFATCAHYMFRCTLCKVCRKKNHTVVVHI